MATLNLGHVKGADGQGLPTGGAVDQIPVKLSGTDYDLGWAWPKAIYPPSLVPNWDNLRNPVNQRGVTSGATVSAVGYFLDCLKLVAGSVVWTENSGLAFASGAKIIGYIEENYRDLLGAIVTFGAQTTGDLVPREVTGAFPAAVAGATVENAYALAGVGTVRFGFEYRSDGTSLQGATQNYVPYVSFEATAAVTVLRMKPELGKVSTLMQGLPDYGLTKLRALRYRMPLGGLYLKPVQILADAIYFSVPAPVAMRTLPSIVDGAITDNSFNPITGFTFAVPGWAQSGGAYYVQAGKTAHGITDPNSIQFSATALDCAI